MVMLWAIKTVYRPEPEQDGPVPRQVDDHIEYTFIEDHPGEVGNFIANAVSTVDVIDITIKPFNLDEVSRATKQALFDLVSTDGTLLDGKLLR